MLLEPNEAEEPNEKKQNVDEKSSSMRTSQHLVGPSGYSGYSPSDAAAFKGNPTPHHGGQGMLLRHRFCPWDGTEFRPLETSCSLCGAPRSGSRYHGKNEQVMSKLLLPPWERVLWKKQPYEDNYVDKTFLESLVTNANFHEYDMWQITKDSVVVSQHLAGTVVFLGMAYLTNYCALPLSYMLALDVLLGMGGAAAMTLTALHPAWQRSEFHSKSAFLLHILGSASSEHTFDFVCTYLRPFFLFMVMLYTLSPVLRTLTRSIDNDTVAFMTIAFLSVHLLCHDYRWVNGRGVAFGASVSLNAAMFVSVLLASRSPSNLHVYLLMCAAVEVFALAPRVYRQVKQLSEKAHGVVTLFLIAIALALSHHINPVLAFVLGSSVVFINCISPLTFIYIQRYKNKINGPWDEAVPIRRGNKMEGLASTGGRA